MYYKISLNKIFKFLYGENKIPFLFNFISLKYRKNKINLKQENSQKKVVNIISISMYLIGI